eukprot:gene46218-59352_t
MSTVGISNDYSDQSAEQESLVTAFIFSITSTNKSTNCFSVQTTESFALSTFTWTNNAAKFQSVVSTFHEAISTAYSRTNF